MKINDKVVGLFVLQYVGATPGRLGLIDITTNPYDSYCFEFNKVYKIRLDSGNGKEYVTDLYDDKPYIGDIDKEIDCGMIRIFKEQN